VEAGVTAPTKAEELEATVEALEAAEADLTQRGIDKLMKAEARSDAEHKEERKEQPKKQKGGKKKPAAAFKADEEAFPTL
jgi:hypothetical protein